jgi:hypothetical protein
VSTESANAIHNAARGHEVHTGLTETLDDELDQLQLEIARLAARVSAFPPHRSLELAVTKLDEARHWLRDRQSRPGFGRARSDADQA